MPGSDDRLDTPQEPDQPDKNGGPGSLRRPYSASFDLADRVWLADRSAAPDAPVPWSRADLRQRLAQLPPGHPSSLGDSDLAHSWRPERQKTELNSAERETGPDGAQDSDSRPAEPEGSTQHTDSSPAEGPAELARPLDTLRPNYWSEVPGFLRAWAEHESRWPSDGVAAEVDRSRDPPGSWRGNGNQYLDPEQNAQADTVIAQVRSAEKTLTADMKKCEQENAYGGQLVGLEFKLKGEDRLKEKIAQLLESGAPDAAPSDVIREIHDAIRYTISFEPPNYVDGYWDVRNRLQSQGYEMHYSESHWSDSQYKGINTRWTMPEGQQFELQFHTAESVHAKQEVTHRSYERIRNPLTTDDERGELWQFQQEVCSWIIAPADTEVIRNYRQEDR